MLDNTLMVGDWVHDPEGFLFYRKGFYDWELLIFEFLFIFLASFIQRLEVGGLCIVLS